MEAKRFVVAVAMAAAIPLTIEAQGRQLQRGRGDRPADLFAAVDEDGDNVVSRREWHWSRWSFEARDANRDGLLSRQEFAREISAPTPSDAYRGGYSRGFADGRAAGREDRERNQGFDPNGQRETETADAGYDSRLGPLPEYQTGYRDGFRIGYPEGYGPR